MQFKAVLAVIAASAISHTVAAPVANEASVENTLEVRKTDAALEAHRANLQMQAYKKFAKLLCAPYGFEYCGPYPVLTNIQGVNKDKFNDWFYQGGIGTHGEGIRLNKSGTTTWNFGDTQVGIHPDGRVFYKAQDGSNCDVTHSGGPKGEGCDEFNYLTHGTNIVPGTIEQCHFYGVNC